MIRKEKGWQFADFVAGLWEALWRVRQDTGKAGPGDTAPKALPGQDDRQRLAGDHKAPVGNGETPPGRDARTEPPEGKDGSPAPSLALVFDREADPTGNALAAGMVDLWFEVQNDASLLRTTDWTPLLKMLPEFLDSGEASSFPENEPDHHGRRDPLSGWDGVLAMSCAYLWWLLREEGIGESVAKEHGGLVIRLARFVFAVTSGRRAAGAAKDPENGVASGERTVATRVDVLRMLISFLHRRELLGTQGEISADVKGLLEDFIDNEDHCCPMLHLGSWVEFFHERDPDWTLRQLPKIFPERADRRDLFVAAWTGYLRPRPCGRVFALPEVRELYRRGLALDPRQDKPYNPRRYDDYEARVAEHLALACMEHDDFDLEDPLFREFLGKRNTRQLKLFARTVGERLGRRDPETTDHMRRRLPKVWEWILENCEEPSLFSRFGGWMTTHAGVMDTATLARLTRRTISKSGGDLVFHHDLTDAVVDMTRAAPGEMIEVVDLFLQSCVALRSRRLPHLREEGSWLKATRILLARDDVGAQERDRLREIERMLRPDEAAPPPRRPAPGNPGIAGENTRAA